MRRLMGSQEGVALPVASAMMLVISLIVVAFFTVSLRVNETSVDDRSSKRALAAAEAGLQTAMYRLNEIGGTPQPTQCFTTNWTPLESGQCPAAPTVELGNGASYTYYVTPQLGAATCLGVTGTTTDRCITAIGTAGGVQRRVQVRVATLTSTAATSFKAVGLMSKSLMHAGNSSEITSDVGANGHVHFGNSAKTFANSSAGIVGGIFYPPGGTYDTSGSSQEIAANPDRQQVAAPYEFPATDFNTPMTTAANLAPGWSRPGMSYTASTRHLRVTSSSASLPSGGTYYFCRFSMANGAKLTFSNSLPTQIYVDSPSREGSFCAGPPVQADPAGTFTLENSNEFNKDGREELVEVFVYGTSQNGLTRTGYSSWCTPAGDTPHTDKCESDVVLGNSVHFEGTIYAPNTTVEANNSVDKFIGAIGADKIRFNNSVKFELTSAVKNSAPPATTTSGVGRGNWVECRPEPTTAGDPESGC